MLQETHIPDNQTWKLFNKGYACHFKDGEQHEAGVKIQKLDKTLKLRDLKNLLHEGRVFILRSQALSAIWFQAKFHDLPKKQADKLVKTFICKGKSRAPTQYKYMKFPRTLGGINVPDIEPHYNVLRMTWIKA